MMLKKILLIKNSFTVFIFDFKNETSTEKKIQKTILRQREKLR